MHVGQDFACSQIGIDQSVDLAAMLDAFADGEDVGIAGAHLVVADDALVDRQAGGRGDLRDGPNAGADDDHVGVERRAVLEVQAGDAVVCAHDLVS